MVADKSAGAKPRTRNNLPPNPAADRSLILGTIAVRLWDFERDAWVTPVVIAQREGVFLVGLKFRGGMHFLGATVEIREAM